MLVGYKSFNKGLVNNYGKPFEIGKTYSTTGPIIAGNNGKGFHMCEHMEDTFRYFYEEGKGDFDVCLVRGSGLSDYKYDEYYDYEMYAFQTMEIIRLLTREEIVNYGIDLRDNRFRKYISTIRLNSEEIERFEKRLLETHRLMELQHLDYYQKGEEDAYVKVKRW